MAAREGKDAHCKTLLEHRANPNVFGKKRDYFKTPLHRARTQKIVQLLLDYGGLLLCNFTNFFLLQIVLKELFLN